MNFFFGLQANTQWTTLALVIGWILTIFIGLLAGWILFLIVTGKIDLSQLISEPTGQASLSRFQFLVFTFVTIGKREKLIIRLAAHFSEHAPPFPASKHIFNSLSTVTPRLPHGHPTVTVLNSSQKAASKQPVSSQQAAISNLSVLTETLQGPATIAWRDS